VGVALVARRGVSEYTVLYHRRIKYTSKRQSKKKIQENLKEAIGFAMDDIVHQGFKSTNPGTLRSYEIEKVLCVFSAPWYRAQIKKVSVEKEEVFTVTRKIIDDEMEKVEKAFELESGKSDKENFFIGGIHAVEREIFGASVNGYEMKFPLMKRGKNLELITFVSVVPHSVREIIRAEVGKRIHTNNFSFYTLPPILTKSLKAIFENENNFLVLRIGLLNTDVVLVGNGVISRIEVLPFGYDGLIQEVKKQFDVESDMAVTLLRLFSEKGADSLTEKTISNIVGEELNRWRQKISSLENFSSTDRVFLITDETFSSVYKDVFTAEIHNEKKIHIFKLDMEIFKGRISFANHVTFDSDLAFLLAGIT